MGSLRNLKDIRDDTFERECLELDKLPKAPIRHRDRLSIAMMTKLIKATCLRPHTLYSFLIKYGTYHLEFISLLRANLLLNNIKSYLTFLSGHPHLFLEASQDVSYAIEDPSSKLKNYTGLKFEMEDLGDKTGS